MVKAELVAEDPLDWMLQQEKEEHWETIFPTLSQDVLMVRHLSQNFKFTVILVKKCKYALPYITIMYLGIFVVFILLEIS